MNSHQTLRNFIVSDQKGRYETAYPVSETQILNAAKTIIKRRYMRLGQPIQNSEHTKEYLMFHLAGYEHEVFACLFLDSKHRIISFEEMFRGTIDGASIYPREVVKVALENNAAAVIFAHNHPSGDAKPSVADKQVTQQLTNALALVNVRVLDHIVIGETEALSFADMNLM